jgi:hypothetical protein
MQAVAIGGHAVKPNLLRFAALVKNNTAVLTPA